MQHAWHRLLLCVKNIVVYDRILNPADLVITDFPAEEKGKRNEF